MSTSTATLDTTGLDRLRVRLERIANPDATDLMQTWMRIIDQDNRRGVMAGLDKDGNPMAPVTYRPVGTPQKLTDAQRNTSNRRARTGEFHGRGPAPAGMNNNLTSREYRQLGGPPLAPRGQFSRVITNLLTGFTSPTNATNVPGGITSGQWTAIGYWEGVVSTKGIPFLIFHFEGRSNAGRSRNVRIPQRDLRGVRPEGRRLAREAMREWAVSLIRQQPTGSAASPSSA